MTRSVGECESSSCGELWAQVRSLAPKDHQVAMAILGAVGEYWVKSEGYCCWVLADDLGFEVLQRALCKLDIAVQDAVVQGQGFSSGMVHDLGQKLLEGGFADCAVSWGVAVAARHAAAESRGRARRSRGRCAGLGEHARGGPSVGGPARPVRAVGSPSEPGVGGPVRPARRSSWGAVPPGPRA